MTTVGRKDQEIRQYGMSVDLQQAFQKKWLPLRAFASKGQDNTHIGVELTW
mgnify:FL=1